jgi:hypothetical protein
MKRSDAMSTKLERVLDELSGASTVPLSQMRGLFGDECYELIGHIRRLELGIASPGMHRNLLERLCTENAELRKLNGIANKNRAEALQLVQEAVTAGERMGNTLRSTETELKLARDAYSEIREIMAMQREQLAAAQRALADANRHARITLTVEQIIAIAEFYKASDEEADSEKDICIMSEWKDSESGEAQPAGVYAMDSEYPEHGLMGPFPASVAVVKEDRLKCSTCHGNGWVMDHDADGNPTCQMDCPDCNAADEQREVRP